jgi:hypothetical protein
MSAVFQLEDSFGKSVCSATCLVPIIGNKDLSSGHVHDRWKWERLLSHLSDLAVDLAIAAGLYAGDWQDAEKARVSDLSLKLQLSVHSRRLTELERTLKAACRVLDQHCIYVSVQGQGMLVHSCGGTESIGTEYLLRVWPRRHQAADVYSRWVRNRLYQEFGAVTAVPRHWGNRNSWRRGGHNSGAPCEFTLALPENEFARLDRFVVRLCGQRGWFHELIDLSRHAIRTTSRPRWHSRSLHVRCA